MKARDVREQLDRIGRRPRKGLGQNFLLDENVLDTIVAALDLQNKDVVLEIGPGLGVLTERLLDRAGTVVAVELDDDLIDLLNDKFGQREGFTLVHADILETDIPALIQQYAGTADRYTVAANLPYYITSAALRHVLESRPRPETIIVLVQREVAERIVAEPGDMSLLAVSVQFYGRPELVTRVHAGAFYPQPDVESAVLRITPYDELPLEHAEIDAFFDVVRAGFHLKRKQLHNSLASGVNMSKDDISSALETAGVDSRRRAETLSVAEWIAVFRTIHG